MSTNYHKILLEIEGELGIIIGKSIEQLDSYWKITYSLPIGDEYCASSESKIVAENEVALKTIHGLVDRAYIPMPDCLINSNVRTECADISAVNARLAAENARLTAEKDRISAEKARLAAENVRLAVENEQYCSQIMAKNNRNQTMNEQYNIYDAFDDYSYVKSANLKSQSRIINNYY